MYKLEKHFLFLTIPHILSTLRTHILLLGNCQSAERRTGVYGAVPVLRVATESHRGDSRWETEQWGRKNKKTGLQAKS